MIYQTYMIEIDQTYMIELILERFIRSSTVAIDQYPSRQLKQIV